MKKDTPLNLILIGVFGTISGRILNRILSNYFGDRGSNTLITLALVVVFCSIIYLFIKKQYLGAIIFLVIFIPLSVGAAGMYLGNMNLLGLGIVLFFIIAGSLALVLPRFIKK